MRVAQSITALAGAAVLSGCATTPQVGPAEVISFVADSGTAQLGQGTIFVESAPGQDSASQELATYKAAVARELVKAGYIEASREQASQIAVVRLERSVIDQRGSGRGPVSVGVGGGTGSYGSGVGLGVGFNLGGSGPRELVDTELGVMIRDKTSGNTLWESRAGFEADTRAELADPANSASALADALFARFPEATGEPLIVELTE